MTKIDIPMRNTRLTPLPFLLLAVKLGLIIVIVGRGDPGSRICL